MMYGAAVCQLAGHVARGRACKTMHVGSTLAWLLFACACRVAPRAGGHGPLGYSVVPVTSITVQTVRHLDKPYKCNHRYLQLGLEGVNDRVLLGHHRLQAGLDAAQLLPLRSLLGLHLHTTPHHTVAPAPAAAARPATCHIGIPGYVHRQELAVAQRARESRQATAGTQ